VVILALKGEDIMPGRRPRIGDLRKNADGQLVLVIRKEGMVPPTYMVIDENGSTFVPITAQELVTHTRFVKNVFENGRA